MLTPKQTIIVREILGAFIWTYKKADNIEYNIDILSTLYKARKIARKTKHYFNKPIVIIIAAIIECVLDDFVVRVKTRVFDPLPNLTSQQIEDFKYKKTGGTLTIKKMEKFDHYIKISQKHNIFKQGIRFYEALNLLKDIRNRIHIQNNKNVLDENEFSVFTDINLNNAERVFEVIIKTMFLKYPRRDLDKIGYKIDDFPFPWK